MDAALAYLRTLQALGLVLEVPRERKLRIPPGYTQGEVALVLFLKPELLGLVQDRDMDLAEERAAILEFDAGFTREQSEIIAGLRPAPALVA